MAHFRDAWPGDAGDAAHGAGEPAVVELQRAAQVRAFTVVDVVPFGGQGGQFPDGVDMAGPAVPQLITRIVLAQYPIRPPPQPDQLAVEGLAGGSKWCALRTGDHWLGLARLIQRFPGATGLATAEVLAQAADPAMAGYWEALVPGEIPGAGEKVLMLPRAGCPARGSGGLW